MQYLDKNGKPLVIGANVTIQYCTGPYGQTRRVTGTLQKIDNFGGMTINLDHNYTYCGYQGFMYDCKKGEPFYVSSVFDSKGKGYSKHEDFEHGHEKWIELTVPR
jgi:hypothetical protein